jgi:hypothetical protein
MSCSNAGSAARLSALLAVALCATALQAQPAPPTPSTSAVSPPVSSEPLPTAAKLDSSGRPTGKGWKPLTNGKDLSEFRHEAEFWKIDKGVMHGITPGTKDHHYMYTARSDYGDFEMHADVKLVGNNSGVCIRIAPTSFDDVPGYQVDMGEGYWGALWDERGRGMVAAFPKERADPLVRRDDWNHYYIRARGHHIEAWLNGVKTIDVVDEKGRSSGPIGFQLCHGDKATDASFKNVYVRELLPKR